MSETITIPVKTVRNEKWAELSAHAPTQTHDICGEKVNQRQDLSFQGNHRVRVYAFKKNVHWKIPLGVSIDIAAVAPAGGPPRRQR